MAVLLVCLVAASTVAPAVATSGPTADDRQRSIDARASGATEAATAPGSDAPADSEATDGGSGVAPLGDGLANASGTVEVVVRMAAADRLAGATAAEATATLKAQAERTQATVTSFAADRRGVRVTNRFWLTNAVVLEVDVDRAGRDVLGQLGSLEGVTRLHRNFEVDVPEPAGNASVDADAPTSDANGYDTTYGLEQVNATEVWSEYGTMGGGVKVAVLDTGVSVDHPDIELFTEDASDPTYPGGWAEFNSSGDRVAGSQPHDTGYHGTHTSGTVSGGNASGEYIGVAPNVSLMHGLSLPGGSGTFAQIVAGMEWAVSEDADVVSLSLGAPGYYSQLIEPVQNARAAGTFVVAASGNDGPGISNTPGNVYEAIAVGATDSAHNVARFSSGEIVHTEADYQFAAPASWPDEYVVPDVTAPGVDTLSAIPEGYVEDHPDAKYGYASGTSMATPHVAGVVALALAASRDAGTDAGVPAVTRALRSTAWKPPSAQYPDLNDTRYGAGIVDAGTAADRVAAAQGILGSVQTSDGTPLEGTTVSLATGYETRTNASGEFRVRTDPGTYELSADGFGYAEATATATVTEGAFASAALTLDPTVEARVDDPLSEGVQQGGIVSVTLTAANLESLTVDAGGEVGTEDLALFVDGQEQAFGEPVAFDGATQSVTVTVRTAANVTGEFSLTHTLSGAGETITVESGPTNVYGEIIDVAAVRSTKQGLTFGDDLASTLRGELTGQYNVTLVDDTEVADVIDQYDVFVVQRFGGDVADTLRRASGPETGLVLLDNYGDRTADAVGQLSAATGDPKTVNGDFALTLFGSHSVSYELLRDHPIFEGVGGPGDSVELFSAIYVTNSWFSGYSGTVLANVSDSQDGERGNAVGVDPLTRTVLLSSLGYRNGAGAGLRTDGADEILANSVEYASAVPPVRLAGDQRAQADEGQAVTVNAEVINLSEYSVELADSSTLDASEVSLYVDGKVASFDQRLAYDGLTSGNFTVRVVPEAGAVGSVSLEHTFVADGERVTGTTGPTAVYDPPLEVPGDVESLQAAADLVPPGGTVVVADGTYTEQVTFTTTGLTVRPALGANATIRAPADISARSVVQIRGADTTFSGFRVEAGGDATGVEIYRADRSAVRNVTVRNAHVGVRSNGANAVTLAGNDVRDATDGIRLEYFYNHRVLRNHVEDVQVGLSLSKSRGIAVRNNTVVDADAMGVDMAAEDILLADTTVRDTSLGVRVSGAQTARNVTITDADTGLEVVRHGALTLRHSTVEAATGVDFWGATGGTLEGNRLDADTAVDVDVRENLSGLNGPPPATVGDITVRYNDVDADVVAAHNNTTAALDARLNYFGPRGPANATTGGAGETLVDPFLTRSPFAVDAPLSEMDHTTHIGTDVRFEAGGTYALGVPGPAAGTVAEVLGEAFTGAVYGYDNAANSWELLDGGESLSALEAVLVVPTSDSRAVFSFHSSGPAAPNERDLEKGLNFVSAPGYVGANTAFSVSTTDPEAVVTLFHGPGSQLGESDAMPSRYTFDRPGQGPTMSAFSGYFLYVESDGSVLGTLQANPDVYQLHDQLGLSANVADSTAGSASLEDRVRAAALSAAREAAATTDDRSEVTRAALTAARGVLDPLPVEMSDRALYGIVRDAVERVLTTEGNDAGASRPPTAATPGTAAMAATA